MTQKLPEILLKRHPQKHEFTSNHEILEPISRQVAITLGNARRQKWLSQKTLAETLHIPQSVISYIESGHGNPKILNIIKIAKYLEIPLGSIFSNSCPVPEVFKIAEAGEMQTLPREIKFKDHVIEFEKRLCFSIERTRQYLICVFEGEIHTLVGKQTVLKAASGEVIVVPGHTELEVFGTSETPARFIIIETPRPEGR